MRLVTTCNAMTPLLFGVNVYVSTHWSVSQAKIRARLNEYGPVTTVNYCGGPTRLVSRCNAVFAQDTTAQIASQEAPLCLDNDHKLHLRINQSVMQGKHRTSKKLIEPNALDRTGRIALLQRAADTGQVSQSSVITALEALDDSKEGFRDEYTYALAVTALCSIGESERAVALLNEAQYRGFPSPINHPAMAGSTIIALIASQRPLDESMRILEHGCKLDVRGFNALIAEAEKQDRDDLVLKVLAYRQEQTDSVKITAASRTSHLTRKRAFLETAYRHSSTA